MLGLGGVSFCLWEKKWLCAFVAATQIHNKFLEPRAPRPLIANANKECSATHYRFDYLKLNRDVK